MNGQLTVNLTDLVIKRFGTWEIKNEVYLVTIGIDLSKVGEIRTPDLLIPEWFQGAHDWLLFGVSPLFTGVRRDDELILMGDGFNLYGPKDPMGKLCLHTAVMESDSDHRKIANRIDQAISGHAVDYLVKMVGTEARMWSMAIRYLFEGVLFFLKCDNDDVICTFDYSSTYRTPRGYCTGRFEFGNRYVDGEMDVRWEDQSRCIDENPY
jgi:hypothetical protein